MNRSEKLELIQEALQGRLTAAQQRALEELLATDSEFRTEFEEERTLDSVLEALPPAPISSNFTARVMREALKESDRAEPRGWWRFRWRPALATAMVAVVLGGFIYQQQRQAAREELAQTLSTFTDVTSTLAAAAGPQVEAIAPEPFPLEPPLPPVVMLQDFQAIQHLVLMPAEQEQDLELYLALHK